MKSKLTRDELDAIDDAKVRLKKVHIRLDDREYSYGQMNTAMTIPVSVATATKHRLLSTNKQEDDLTIR